MWLPPYPLLVWFAAALCCLCKRVCGSGHVFPTTPFGWSHTLVDMVIVVPPVPWRSAACNILALVLMCVRGLSLLVPSYHDALLWRWRLCCACGGLPVRACPSFSACVACGGGMGHLCVCGHTFLLLLQAWAWLLVAPLRLPSCVACNILALLVAVCGSLLAHYLLCVLRHTFCSLCKRALCVFVFACVVPSLGCVWFPSCVLLLLLASFVSLHTSLFSARRWWPCCACGGMHVRAYLLLPFAPCASGRAGVGSRARLGVDFYHCAFPLFVA